MYTRFRAPIAAAVTALLVSALSITVATPAQAAATIVNGTWSVAPDPGYNIFHFDGSITSAGALFPDGNSVTVATTGTMSIYDRYRLGRDQAPTGTFSPEVSSAVTPTTPTIEFFHNGTGCAVSGLCDPSIGGGTFTLTFAQPVVNPVLHLTGMTGWVDKHNAATQIIIDASTMTEVLKLSSSTPAGVTIGPPLASPRSVLTTSDTISVVPNPLPAGGTGVSSLDCASYTIDGYVSSDTPVTAEYYAGCGSVPIIGTVKSLTFDANLYYAIARGLGYNTPLNFPPPGDVFGMAISYEAIAVPALTLAKSVSPTTVTAAGQAVTYSFLVTNTGNTSISGVGINELAFSGTGTMGTLTCPETTLAPGASTTCTAAYEVTQADVDAGTVTNNAQATGTSATGAAVTSNESPATITASQTSSLSLVKSVTSPPSTVGATATYSFVVTNTGNTTLTGIGISETAFSGSGTLSTIACPADPLLPTKSLTCTATYAVTAADITAGGVTNTAQATGVSPTKAPVTSKPDDAAFTLTAQTPTTTATASPPVTTSPLLPQTGGETLPRTGAEPAPLVLMAVAMIGIGGTALLLISPRRLRRR